MYIKNRLKKYVIILQLVRSYLWTIMRLIAIKD